MKLEDILAHLLNHFCCSFMVFSVSSFFYKADDPVKLLCLLIRETSRVFVICEFFVDMMYFLLIFTESFIDFEQLRWNPLLEFNHFLNFNTAIEIFVLWSNCHFRIVVCIKAHSIFIMLILSILPYLFPQLRLKRKYSICLLIYIVIFYNLANIWVDKSWGGSLELWLGFIGCLFQNGFVFNLVDISRRWPLVKALLMKGTVRPRLF